MFELRKGFRKPPQVDEVPAAISENRGEAGPIEPQADATTERVKTRFLNFRFTADPEFGEQADGEQKYAEILQDQMPNGRLTIVGGAGRGHSFALLDGVARIGRADNQEIQLGFGDSSVSRDSHAMIIHYGGRNGFVIRDGRRTNPVLLNGRSIDGEKKLTNDDLIRVGETTLRFKEFFRVIQL